jgi:hypothetical protein
MPSFLFQWIGIVYLPGSGKATVQVAQGFISIGARKGPGCGVVDVRADVNCIAPWPAANMSPSGR